MSFEGETEIRDSINTRRIGLESQGGGIVVTDKSNGDLERKSQGSSCNNGSFNCKAMVKHPTMGSRPQQKRVEFGSLEIEPKGMPLYKDTEDYLETEEVADDILDSVGTNEFSSIS